MLKIWIETAPSINAFKVALGLVFVFLPSFGYCDITGIAIARNTGSASAASGGDNLKVSFITPTTGNGFDSLFLSSLKLFTFTVSNVTNPIIAKLYDSNGITQLGSDSHLAYNFAHSTNSFIFDNSNFGNVSLTLSQTYYLHITGLDGSLGGQYTSYADALVTPTSFGTPGAFFTSPTIVNTELNLANLGFELTAQTSVPELSSFILTSIAIFSFVIFKFFIKLKIR